MSEAQLPATSNDIHDILTLIDGRSELPREFEAASPGLRSYVRDGLVGLSGHAFFAYGVESATSDYGRAGAGASARAARQRPAHVRPVERGHAQGLDPARRAAAIAARRLRLD